MSEYTREMIGNCRRWIKDLTDDSVNEILCADEFAGLLDDALDEIERQQARIAELKEFINQLIEAGEKMFAAVIAAADPYDEGMRVWDKIVNDWKGG